MSRQQTSMHSEPACFGSTMAVGVAAAVLTVSAAAELLLLGSSGFAGSSMIDEGPGSGEVDVRDVTFQMLI